MCEKNILVSSAKRMHFKTLETLDRSFMYKRNSIGPRIDPWAFEYLHALWGHVRENIDPNPIVINSQDLLDDPKRILTKFCELTGLPYHDSLLHWDASTDVIKNWKAVADNLVYRAMYNQGITSTEFLPSKEPMAEDQLTDDVIRLADASMTCYNDMNKHRMV